VRVAMVKRALHDAPHCGDGCGYWRGGGQTILCVVDGLGHGPYAEKAARAAIDCVTRHLSESLPDIFAVCNEAIRGTRGVAMGIAVIDEEAQQLTYAGIGNTRALIARGRPPAPIDRHGTGPCRRVAEGRTIRMSSNWGIVGGGYKTLTPETVPLMPGDLVILFTDGLAEAIDLAGYNDALRADVQRLAGKILGDWGRETDDAAVLVFSMMEVA